MNLRYIQFVAIILWGWQTDLIWFALPMAIVWEAQFFFNRRWALTQKDFYQIADLTIFEAEAYDVIRGGVENLSAAAGVVDLGPVTCVASGTPATSVEDDGTPAVGSAFFYVVRYIHGPTTSEYGWSSENEPRIPGPGDCVP